VLLVSLSTLFDTSIAISHPGVLVSALDCSVGTVLERWRAMAVPMWWTCILQITFLLFAIGYGTVLIIEGAG